MVLSLNFFDLNSVRTGFMFSRTGSGRCAANVGCLVFNVLLLGDHSEINSLEHQKPEPVERVKAAKEPSAHVEERSEKFTPFWVFALQKLVDDFGKAV